MSQLTVTPRSATSTISTDSQAPAPRQQVSISVPVRGETENTSFATKSEPIAPIEAKTEAPAKPAEPSKEDQERFAQLAKREKAIRTEARRLEALKKEIEVKEQARQPLVFDKSAFLKDPSKFGLSNDELSNVVLASLNQDPQAQRIQQLEAQILELKGLTEKTTQSIQDQQNTAYQQAVKQISREVESLVGSSEDYATIKATNSSEAVVELIERTFKEDGIVLKTDEAAKQVEEYLLEEALTLARLPKVQTRLSPPTPQPEATKQQPTMQQQSARTLTHSLAAASKPLTNRERRERAIAAFNGNQS